MPGKSSKHIPQVVVKNGDESHGIESLKNHLSNQQKREQKTTGRWFKVPFLGWSSDPFQRVKWPPTIGDQKLTTWITWQGIFSVPPWKCELLTPLPYQLVAWVEFSWKMGTLSSDETDSATWRDRFCRWVFAQRFFGGKKRQCFERIFWYFLGIHFLDQNFQAATFLVYSLAP